MKKPSEFIQQLEILIEDDDAYGSSVNLLSFEVANNGNITGRFQDTWNRRVFSYTVQESRFGYKPAIASNNSIVGIRFEYPPFMAVWDEEIFVGFSDLEDMGELGQEIRDALEQQLNLNAT